MKFIISLLVFSATFACAGLFPRSDQTVDKIVTEIHQSQMTYKNLAELVNQIGARVSGSAQAEQAVGWMKAKMESLGLEQVRLQPCQVPQWDRGSSEHATLTLADGTKVSLAVTALGGSVGTGKKPVEAEVVQVHSFSELERLGNQVKGKIVFFNQPLDATLEDQFEAYSRVVGLRVGGASKAAKQGAVATLLRSLSSLPDDDHPHTGIMHYENFVNKIPSAALSTHAANLLSNALTAQGKVKVKLELSAGPVRTVTSHNVMGEITGSTYPNEVFLIGGHLDSWDLGRGAHDDGAGLMQSLEVLRAFKVLGIRPKRTVRLVAFMTEEFGGIGAEAYAKEALASGDRFIGALESDRGGFKPLGFSVHARPEVLKQIQSWAPYFVATQTPLVKEAPDGGTDTERFGQAGVPEFELLPTSTHYFDLHHSALDQLSAVNPAEVSEGAAAMAVFVYLATENGFH